MRARPLCLALTALAALLSGCGLKGPLYLPQQKKASVPSTPAASPPPPNQSPAGAAPSPAAPAPARGDSTSGASPAPSAAPR